MKDVVAGMIDALKAFNPLELIEAAWRQVKEWFGDFSVTDAAGKVVGATVEAGQAVLEGGRAAAGAVGNVAADAWETVSGWWGGDDQDPVDAIVGAVGMAREAIVSRLGDVVTAIQSLPASAPARAAVAAAVIATAVPVAAQAAPARTVNVSVTANISLQGSGEVDIDAIVAALEPRLQAMMYRVSEAAFEVEADEVEG